MLNDDNKSTDWQIQHAVEHLKAGNIVAFPTETVYGLGADARNKHAIEKVFLAKERPIDHPLIVHLSDQSKLADWAVEIPPSVWRLVQHCWPGPLTVVLPKQASVSDLITGGQPSVALRVPRHPLTLAMLRAFGSGIVGPSANRHGRISPTDASHVETELGSRVDYILPGGPCGVGIESTIVSFMTDEPVILREGAYSPTEISQITGCPVKIAERVTPKTAPGTLSSHYAPTQPLYLITSDFLEKTVLEHLGLGRRVGVISFQESSGAVSAALWLQAGDQPAVYAQSLYANLRRLDEANIDVILIEKPPLGAGWSAVHDRLKRASCDTLQRGS